MAAQAQGYVLFKIKTSSDLAVNSSVSQAADIFFDYNFPVNTGNTVTTFSQLGAADFAKSGIVVYPNPANTLVSIKSEKDIIAVGLYDIQGRLLQTGAVSGNQATLDVSSQQTGMYVVKVTSGSGTAISRVLKK